MVQLKRSDSRPIHSLGDWTRPKQPYHWKERRSAMELARAWCNGGEPRCPQELRIALDSHPLTLGARLIEGSPEHVTALPGRGNGRNHDLWVRAETGGAPLTICVEAKADESFGDRVGAYLRRAHATNARTGAGLRTRALARIVFQKPVDVSQEAVSSLRYQLLAAAAGTVLQAVRDRATTAVLVVHEFQSTALDPRKLHTNDSDLRAFCCALAGERVALSPGGFVGPWPTLPDPDSGSVVNLLIGKIVTNVDKDLPRWA